MGLRPTAKFFRSLSGFGNTMGTPGTSGSVSSRKFHLEITANQSRESVLAEAVITELKDISPTVKKVVLKIDNEKFSFKAGQWVDFYIPDEKIVGGLSICSAPKLLKEKREIELAVKKSKHPPIRWIHEMCSVGNKVQVRAGGDFFYDPQPSDPSYDLLLIAGGVGINPLRSILLHDKDLADEFASKSFGYCPGKAKLLYSAQSVDEVLFKEDFARISVRPDFQCQLFASQSKKLQPFSSHFVIEPGRITPLDISTTFTGAKPFLNIEKLLCFICGPKEMVVDMAPLLEECGVKPEKILYEAWTVATINKPQ